MAKMAEDYYIKLPESLRLLVITILSNSSKSGSSNTGRGSNTRSYNSSNKQVKRQRPR